MPNQQINQNAIDYFNSPQNLGGYKSFRVFYSEAIVQQDLQTESQLKELNFIKSSKPFAFSTVAKFDFDVTHEFLLTEDGPSENIELKWTIWAQGNEAIFVEWFRKYLQARNLCLAITTMQNTVVVYNPFWATYTYLPGNQFSQSPRFEITFRRAKFLPFEITTFKIIETVTVQRISYGPTFQNQTTINLFQDCSIDVFEFGYSLVDDYTTVTYQKSNILTDLTDGVFYFFAYNRALKIFDSVKATIDSGIITQDTTYININNYILDENTIFPDEGEIVSD